MKTVDEIAELMKQEILYDVSRGMVPRSVPSFSALHDYVDANCYGNSEALLEELDTLYPDDDQGHTAALNRLCDLMNPAIELVDAWIRSNGIGRNLSARNR